MLKPKIDDSLFFFKKKRTTAFINSNPYSKNQIQTSFRYVVLNNLPIGFKIKIYNGKLFNTFYVKRSLLGLKLGQLSVTRLKNIKLKKKRLKTKKKK